MGNMHWRAEAIQSEVHKGRSAAYSQIADFFRERIMAGGFVVGEKIPTELEVMGAFAVGRQTARNAIQMLSTEGLVQKFAGRGTFVTRNAPPARKWMVDTFDSFMAQDYPGSTSINSVDWVNKSEAGFIRPAHNAWKEDRMLRIQVDRTVADTVMSHALIDLPEWIGQKIHDEVRHVSGKAAMVRLLERKCDVHLQVIRQSTLALAASPLIAQRLGVEAGSPVFCLRNVFLDGGGRTVELSQIFFRRDAYEHHSQISR